jgi:hypothetical protein
MGFRYHHLDEPGVRHEMLRLWSDEDGVLVRDGSRADCYGADLIEAGWDQWAEVMPDALENRNDDWLWGQMNDPTLWRSHRPRRLKSGGYSQMRVNLKGACDLLCFGEFNIAYVRGLAHWLQGQGETECVVYRAQTAGEPRCECTDWEGERFALRDVIAGHRARYWPSDTKRPEAFSVPSGFNCHHSIRRIDS